MCESIGDKEYHNGGIETDKKETFEAIFKTYLRSKCPILIDEKCHKRLHGECYTTSKEILCSEVLNQKPNNQQIYPQH